MVQIPKSVLRWLEKQGLSTVLLFVFTAGVWFRLPQMALEVESRQTEQVKSIADAFREDQERDTELLLRLLRDFPPRLARGVD